MRIIGIALADEQELFTEAEVAQILSAASEEDRETILSLFLDRIANAKREAKQEWKTLSGWLQKYGRDYLMNSASSQKLAEILLTLPEEMFAEGMIAIQPLLVPIEKSGDLYMAMRYLADFGEKRTNHHLWQKPEKLLTLLEKIVPDKLDSAMTAADTLLLIQRELKDYSQHQGHQKISDVLLRSA